MGVLVMGLGNFTKNVVKLAGAITKVSVEVGTEVIGSIAEKVDDNPQSREKVVNYGKTLGQAIKKNTNELAEKSVDIVDKAVETGIKAYKKIYINEDLIMKANEDKKKNNENQYSNEVLKNSHNTEVKNKKDNDNCSINKANATSLKNEETYNLDNFNKTIEHCSFSSIPYDTDEYNKYSKDISSNLIVQIDRSEGYCTPHGEDVWQSGEKIEIRINMLAKYNGEYIISEDGDCAFSYNRPKVHLFYGVKYTYSGDVGYGDFPGDVKHKEELTITELNEVQIFEEMNKYYRVIFSKLERSNLFYTTPIEIDECNWDSTSMCDYWEDEYNRRNACYDENGEEIWTREDYNEYYGYERDYEGDWD